MATIYQKAITGNLSNQSVILDRFEGLQYPLPTDIQNWKNLRIGIVYSFIGATGNNSNYLIPDMVGENYFYSESLPWIGLKTNNNIFPGNDGCAFIGFGSTTKGYLLQNYFDNTHMYAIYSNTNQYGSMPFIMGSGNYTNSSYKIYNYTYPYQSSSSFGRGITASPSQFVNSGNCMIKFGMSFLKVSGESAINYRYKTNGTASAVQLTNDDSIESLRLFLSDFESTSSDTPVYNKNNQTNNFSSADPFTMDGTLSGTPIPSPDSFFIYWPFGGSRIRVHNFCIEKYS